LIDLTRDFDTSRQQRRDALKHLLTGSRGLLRTVRRHSLASNVIGSVGFHIQSGGRTMKVVKLIVAITIAAVLTGCVVYPVGYRGGGGYYGGGGHHHQGGHYHRR
jgi:hypothetical protein